MKKLLFLSSLLVISVAFMLYGTQQTYADSAVEFVPQSTDVNKIGGCSDAAAQSAICRDIASDGNPLFGADGVLTKVSGIFAMVTGVISVFMMLIGGLRYINSNGDPQKTATARKTIIYAVIGVIVATVGGVLVRFILTRLA